MKAETLFPSGLLKIEGVKPRFHEFVLGAGWLDPSGHDHFAKHWLVCIGHQETDVYTVVAERHGSLAEIAEAAVDLKDQFLVKRFYVNHTAIAATQFLEDWDGLTHYIYKGYNRHKQKQWLNPDERWQYFRGRDEDKHALSLCPVPDVYRADFQSCVDNVINLLAAKRLQFRKACPRSWWVTRQDLDTMLNHPIMKAIAWPLMVLELEKAIQTTKRKDVSPRYGNLKR